MKCYAIVKKYSDLLPTYLLIDPDLTLHRPETPVIPLFLTEHAAHLVSDRSSNAYIFELTLPSL